MRTARAPTTALRGGSISEDPLATSMAILAAPYAAFQRDSFDDPASSERVSKGFHDGEQIDKAMELDETASALGSPAFKVEWVRATSFMNLIGDVGGLLVGVTSDGDCFRG